jgi:tetratricopeptide (TPR) repeat protein
MSFMPKPPPAPRSTRPTHTTGVTELLQRGLAAHKAGRLDEAHRHYTAALAREPRNAPANHLLGLIHLARQDAATGATLIARAVGEEPRNHQYLGNLGVALNAAGRPQEALTALDKAVKLAPDFAEAHSNRGMVLRALGRLEQAAEAYGAAIRLRPAEAGFHFNLANTQEDSGDFAEAETSYRRSDSLRPRHARTLAGIARMLVRLGRTDEALETARRAVEANGSEPDAHLALGTVHRIRGELEDAVRALDRLVAVDPGNSEALFDRAMLRVHAARDDSFALMERVLRDPARPVLARARAGFALGKTLSDIGEHTESRAIFDDANALMLRKVQLESGALDQMRQLATDFESIPPALLDAGYRDAAPIFVVGLPRSGKTTIESLLAQGVGVAALGELPRFPRLVAALGAGGAVKALAPESLAALGQAYADYGRALAGGADTWIDTMPANFNLVGHIRLALPNARIVWCIRDPLDQCVALYEKFFGKGGHGYTYDLAALAAHYRAYRDLGAAWQRLFPAAMLTIDAGTLRTGDGSSLRNLFAVCGLDAPPNVVIPESEPQLGERADSEKSARRAAHLSVYRNDLAPLLAGEAPKPALPSSPGDNR